MTNLNYNVPAPFAVYANAAAAEASLAAHFENDEYTTYRVVIRGDARAIIVAYDEDGFELGAV